MSPFSTLVPQPVPADRETWHVMMVLTDKDFATLESLLAKVPYEHAEPVMRAFRSASALQRGAGMLDVVEKVLELHQSAVTHQDRRSTDETPH